MLLYYQVAFMRAFYVFHVSGKVTQSILPLLIVSQKLQEFLLCRFAYQDNMMAQTEFSYC